MTEEFDSEATASEDVVAGAEEETSQQEESQRMVPLTALESERRKRQDLEVQNRNYQDYIEKIKSDVAPQEQEDEDDDALMDRREFKQHNAAAKREIREEVFRDMNPTAMDKIKQYLNPILEKKPWLAESIKNSENRYARAAEIIDDYQHLVNPKASFTTSRDGARIVQNSQKPGSPVQLAKSASPNNMEYLKSMQGKKEFREYRQKVLRGDL